MELEKKKEYVFRYWAGEKAIDLGREMIKNKEVSCLLTTASKNVFRWQKGVSRSDYKKSSFYQSSLKITKFTNVGKFAKQKIFAHIEKQSSKNISVRTLCKSFNVSRAGYYKWLLKKEQEQNLLNNNRKGKYDEFILKLVKDAFLDNRMIYGHRRIKVYLQREYGLKLNKETIRRYMSYYGYKSIIRRKSKHRERKNVRYIKPDLIQRNFKSDKPFNKIYTDVTFIPINGKLDKFGYLSVAIDGFNQEVVGYSFSKNNNTKLVMDTMEKLEKGIVESEEVIIHSDHGSQYSSIEYLDFILKNKIKQSMSRVGNSLDNRPAEYFFSILKEEYIRESYKYTFEEIENMIKKSVLHYNVIRFQKALKNLTPIEYRNEVNC